MNESHGATSEGSDRWYVRAARRSSPLEPTEERALTACLERHRETIARDVLGSRSGRAYLRRLQRGLAAGTIDVRDVIEAEADERVDDMRRTCLARLARIERLVARARAGAPNPRERQQLVRLRRALRLRREHVDAVIADMEESRPKPTAALAAVRETGQAAGRARARLVEAHLRLVVSIARRHLRRGLDLPDLVQEGTIGLMRAADRFEPSRGVTFATYAAWWVRQTIGRALANQARPIRLPISVEESLQRVRVQRRHLTARHGRTPTPVELAEETRLSAARVGELIRIERQHTVPHLTLDQPAPDDPGGRTLVETLADEAQPGPEETAMAHGLAEHTARVLASLAPREQEVLRLRYGLGCDSEHTLEEIGERFGLTRQRILQIAAKALGKLRTSRHARALRSFCEP